MYASLYQMICQLSKVEPSIDCQIISFSKKKDIQKKNYLKKYSKKIYFNGLNSIELIEFGT